MILDEAQRIKNWATRAARSVKQIRSPYAVVLTGTPLENRLEELISIVQFVDPHRLGPTFRLLHEHQVRDESGRVVGYRDLDRLGETLAPILLRRRKDQVLDQLPERIESTVFVPMTPAPARHPHREPGGSRPDRAEVAAVPVPLRSGQAPTDDRASEHADGLRLAATCIDPKTDQGLKASEIVTLLDEAFEQPETKVVVFSQWLRMHELLVKAAKKRKWGHVLFHGGVPGRDRGKLVETNSAR